MYNTECIACIFDLINKNVNSLNNKALNLLPIFGNKSQAQQTL